MKKFTIIMTVLIAMTIKTNAQIPNNGFENWTSMGSYYNPVSWSCLNDMTASASTFTCEKGTPGNPGSYYLKLTSKTVSGMGVMPGIAVSGTFNQSNMQPLTGFAFNQRPANLTGSWQHMIFGSSQGYVDVQLTRWDTPMQMRLTVASVHYVLSGMEMSWADFTIPLNYVDGNNPDSCIITFSASGSTPSNYDYLYVDNLAFSGSVTGVTEIADIKALRFYPNPASSVINIDLLLTESIYQINMYDLQGRMVKVIKNGKLSGNQQITVNVEDIPSGTYLFFIATNVGYYSNKVVIE